jgi:hypothetical protein
MKTLLLLATLFASAASQADELRIPVPAEGWALKLAGPAFKKADVANVTEGRVYVGTSGKFNVSLHVTPPMCEGGDAPDNIYRCFGERMQSVPYIIGSTIRAQKMADGVQVMYMMDAPAGEWKKRVFNINVVFARKGKWGDLHISVVEPEKADLEQALNMAKSLSFSDVK